MSKSTLTTLVANHADLLISERNLKPDVALQYALIEQATFDEYYHECMDEQDKYLNAHHDDSYTAKGTPYELVYEIAGQHLPKEVVSESSREELAKILNL